MDSIVETATGTHNFHHFIKRTIQFIILVSFFSSLYSYFSGFHFFFSYNLQFSTLIFPLFAQALDRKYMFLICNGILAFLAKNLTVSSTGLNHTKLMQIDEDEAKQITELPPVLEVATVQENVASVVGEEDYGDTNSGDILASEELEEDDEDDDDELIENRGLDSSSSKEEVNDATVSTEELNKKFEEFIRKMKEEIRIEAQQKLITV